MRSGSLRGLISTKIKVDYFSKSDFYVMIF
jgi:hypothetical protein